MERLHFSFNLLSKTNELVKESCRYHFPNSRYKIKYFQPILFYFSAPKAHSSEPSDTCQIFFDLELPKKVWSRSVTHQLWGLLESLKECVFA